MYLPKLFGVLYFGAGRRGALLSFPTVTTDRDVDFLAATFVGLRSFALYPIPLGMCVKLLLSTTLKERFCPYAFW